MVEENWVTFKEFREVAKISAGTVTYIKKNDLFKDGLRNNRINLNHPLTKDYIRRKIVSSSENKAKKLSSSSEGKEIETIFDFIPANQKEKYSLDDLKNMTLYEIVKNFGNITYFKSYVAAQTTMQDFEIKDLKLRKDREKVIDRQFVKSNVLNLLAVLYKQLLSSELPQLFIEKAQRYFETEKTPAEKIHAEYLRLVSQVLEHSKQEIVKSL